MRLTTKLSLDIQKVQSKLENFQPRNLNKEYNQSAERIGNTFHRRRKVLN